MNMHSSTDQTQKHRQVCAVEISFLDGGALSLGRVNLVIETSVQRMCVAEGLSDGLKRTLWPK